MASRHDFGYKPRFQGESDIEQLALVIRTLGTPTWKGITSLPDYNKISFPPAKPQPWESLLPDVDPVVIAIVSALLTYDPSARLTARQVEWIEFVFMFPINSAN